MTDDAPDERPPPFPGNAPPPFPAPSYPSGGYPPPPGPFGQPSPGPDPYGAPSYGTPEGAPYAGWGTRVGGFLIDAVLVVVVQFALGRGLRTSNALAVHFTTKTNGGTVVHHDRISVLALILTLVLALLYATVLCGGSRGQTVGMMAVGIRVVRADTFGPTGYGAALGRSIIAWLFWVLFVLWILDVLFPLWDRRNQTLHDKIVKTVVIRVRGAR